MTRPEPVHPGETLKHDFVEPFELSATALAKAIGMTPTRINEIVRGPTALRLARFFGTDAQSRMDLQSRYERSRAQEAAAGSSEAIRPLEAARSRKARPEKQTATSPHSLVAREILDRDEPHLHEPFAPGRGIGHPYQTRRHNHHS